ncbi:MAG: hypothetical protein QXG48_02765 [Thermofilaceae archaeon]
MAGKDIDIERLIRAPFTTKHESVVEAILADLADVVPIVGEIAGIARVAEAAADGDYERLILELGDLVAGLPPILGEAMDALTPTNLLMYLTNRR